MRQSPEADPRLESAMFSLDLSWVDSSPQQLVLSLLSCSSVLPEATLSLLGTYGGVLGGSSLPGLSAVPAADISLCGFDMGPPARLIVRCTAGGMIFLFVQGINDEPDEHWSGGLLIRGMSNMGRMGIGGVSVWHAGLLMEAGACGPFSSAAVVATVASALCCTVVASTSFM